MARAGLGSVGLRTGVGIRGCLGFVGGRFRRIGCCVRSECRSCPRSRSWHHVMPRKIDRASLLFVWSSAALMLTMDHLRQVLHPAKRTASWWKDGQRAACFLHSSGKTQCLSASLIAGGEPRRCPIDSSVDVNRSEYVSRGSGGAEWGTVRHLVSASPALLRDIFLRLAEFSLNSTRESESVKRKAFDSASRHLESLVHARRQLGSQIGYVREN